jgi:hypothetical protein
VSDHPPAQPGADSRPPAPVTLIPAGHQGKLSTPGRDAVPVRVFERGSDVLMLVVLLDADTGLEPAPTEPMLLEYSSGHGLVRVCGEATMEARDLIRFAPAAPAEVLQRRDFVRIDAGQPVALNDALEGSAVEAHAVDISGGGMLLHGLDDFDEGERVRFTLALAPGEPPIHGTARVVRIEGKSRRGVVFEAISSSDRQRLIHFIFDRQRAARARTRDSARKSRRTR